MEERESEIFKRKNSKDQENFPGENQRKSAFRKESQAKRVSIKEDFIPQFTTSLISVYKSAELDTREELGKEVENEGDDEEEAEQEEEGDEEIAAEEDEKGEEESQEGEAKEKSEGESATTSEALSNVYAKLSPFTIKWTFGSNIDVELINLTTADTFEVFYSSSHFGVLYNYSANTMTFLPGHNYLISSIAADASGRWLVSADAGEDTVIIIWDNKKRLPAWSLYNVFPGEGTRCVSISQDARFLAAVNCNFNHTLKFWLWTYGRDEPDGIVNVDPAFGKANHVDFNHMQTEQFALATDSRVVFCEWVNKSRTIQTFTPEFELGKKKVGNLRRSIFLDDNHTALTTTGQGYVIVWSDVEYSEPVLEEIPGTINKKYLKHVRIHKSGITSIRLCDGIVVSSSEEGIILFHDQLLRLLYWLPKLRLDPLVSVSFNLSPVPLDSDPFSSDFHDGVKHSLSDEEVQNVFEYEELPKEKTPKETESCTKNISLPGNLFPSEKSDGDLPNPSDCAFESKPFVIRDFVFLTTTGKIGYMSHRRGKVKYYLYNTEAPIVVMDCNPNRDHIVMGSSQGRLILCEYHIKKVLITTQFPVSITALKFSHLGYCLMAGFQNGLLLELDSFLLTVRFRLEQSNYPIQKICFSPNDEILAYYDQSSTVYVHMKKAKLRQWTFMGKYISHYKPIVDILFEESQDSKSPRLFTIGEDRMLVEYDMNNLGEHRLKLLNITRVEQTAVPCSFAWVSKFHKTPQFIVSNNEYKLKVLDSDSHVCQKTTLGPTADTPIKFMRIVSEWDSNTKNVKMVYATDKHIGLRILPVTGNPFEGMGMVAHHEKIVAIAISNDHKYIFTVGINDANVLMWELNPSSVDVASQLGGIGLEPFVSLIEGGPNSFLFKEIEDFFYYAQIIHQGEDPNLDRSVSKKLALCEIPDLFRSLGYYPTNYEIDNLLHELKHLNYHENGEITTEVTFEECVKAFLNHRPVHGISMDDINKALLAIVDSSDPSDVIIERSELYRALEERAEQMSHAEAVGYLCILLLPKDENNPFPPNMKVHEFAENVLGIDLSITEENVHQITHAFETKNP